MGFSLEQLESDINEAEVKYWEAKSNLVEASVKYWAQAQAEVKCWANHRDAEDKPNEELVFKDNE